MSRVDIRSVASEIMRHTGEFIKLERKGYRKEEQLVGNGDNGRYPEVVIVENMGDCHGNNPLVPVTVVK